MKKLSKSPLIAAIGTAVVTSLAAGNVAAGTNPFGVSELPQGYMQLAGVVPEEGAAKPAAAASEMKCGASMNMDKDAAPKKVDGSCGEGKCGAMMDGGKMKKGMESVCGAMMKGKEGACGAMGKDEAAKPKTEMSCGASMKKENGEMACGAMMKGGADAKAVEAKCAGKK